MRTINAYRTSAPVPTAVLAAGPIDPDAPVAAGVTAIDGRLVIVVVGPMPGESDVVVPEPIAILVALPLTVDDPASVETVILRMIVETPATPLQRVL